MGVHTLEDVEVKSRSTVWRVICIQWYGGTSSPGQVIIMSIKIYTSWLLILLLFSTLMETVHAQSQPPKAKSSRRCTLSISGDIASVSCKNSSIYKRVALFGKVLDQNRYIAFGKKKFKGNKPVVFTLILNELLGLRVAFSAYIYKKSTTTSEIHPINKTKTVELQIEDATDDGRLPDPLVTSTPTPTATPTPTPTPTATPTYSSPGTAIESPDTCTKGTGTLPRSSCRVVDVDCPGLALQRVEIRISEPDPNSTLKGTTVFGTGAGGTQFYEQMLGGVAASMLEDLSDNGFRVIQRAWIGPWESTTIGMAHASCRYATLLDWINTNYHDTNTGLCAIGNSGGSAEIGYALALWGQEVFLDQAILVSGPPMSNIDQICIPSTGWEDECMEHYSKFSMECSPTPQNSCYVGANASIIDYAYSPGTPCANQDANFSSTFLNDSIGAPGTDFDYSLTQVDFRLGLLDCTSAFPSAIKFHDLIISSKSLATVSQAPHELATTQAGVDAIYDTVVNGCIDRH